MKTGNVTKKIIGGKLVRIDVAFGERIETVKITGDFFLHPEDTLEEIIDVLEGTLLPVQHEELVQKVAAVLEKNNAQLIGAGADDIITILEEAVACSSE